MWGWVRRFGHRFRKDHAWRTTPARGAASPPTDAGYALTDALVALLILSLALVLGLRAASQARTVIEQAREIRGAQTLLAQLIETGPRSYQDAAGQTDAFSWTVETRSTGAAQPVALCHRSVAVMSRASHRVFSAATLETCPVGAPA